MSSEYDNNGQYSRYSTLRYEKIFGPGFVSSGGLHLTKSFCERMDFPQNARVLDIGSGLGGAAFFMKEVYNATVLGVDLSAVMVEIAQERVEEHGVSGVSFVLDDVRTMTFDDNSFDVIWSRDALLHIPEKKELFARLSRWLAPGGQIMITDYARHGGDVSEAFHEYMTTSGYDLLDVESYAALLAEAGFARVHHEDWSQQFVEILRSEQQALRDDRDVFLQDFSAEDLDYLMERWERKIQFCLTGDMRVGMWHGWGA